MIRLLILASFALAACHRGGSAEGASSGAEGWEDWAGLARAEPPCAPALVVPDARWAAVSLRDPAGSLRLPPSLREQPSGEPRTRVWVAADSTELVVWAADEPVGGVAGSGGLIARLERPRYRLEDGCRLRVDGHLATVARFRHVDARGTDTVFGAVANVLVRRGLAVAAMALSPSCAMRDSLVGAISDLRVETPGR